MAEKPSKPKKPKGYAKLSQKQKFIEAAKAADTDESGTTFREALGRLVRPIVKNGR